MTDDNQNDLLGALRAPRPTHLELLRRELLNRQGLVEMELFIEYERALSEWVWRQGFDAGERDVWEHELHNDFDSPCIQNPYKTGGRHVGE